jgi:AraC-like DNA-binding protein
MNHSRVERPPQNRAQCSRRSSEFAKLWRDGALGDLELLHAQFMTQSFAPHTHDTYAIGIVESGAESFAYRGRHEAAGAGTLAVIHPGELHTGGPLGGQGWRYRALYPTPTLIEQTVAEMGGKGGSLPFFREPVIVDPELFREFVHMHQRLEHNAPLLERESWLIWALSRLIERYADPVQEVRPPKPARRDVSLMVDYLHDNLPANITLEELASLTQLSKFHLVRLFRAEMGLPPHTYLNQLRIDRAKSLLLSGARPADVAAQMGFADQAHLTRLFKRTVGVTPGVVAPDRSAELGTA